jgi:hypothetical protein
LVFGFEDIALSHPLSIPFPESPSCKIGTLDALKLMISGGWIAGGRVRSVY